MVQELGELPFVESPNDRGVVEMHDVLVHHMVALGRVVQILCVVFSNRIEDREHGPQRVQKVGHTHSSESVQAPVVQLKRNNRLVGSDRLCEPFDHVEFETLHVDLDETDRLLELGALDVAVSLQYFHFFNGVALQHFSGDETTGPIAGMENQLEKLFAASQTGIDQMDIYSEIGRASCRER